MISNATQWARIELRHLVALQAIAETASFGRAALLVGYTQSAISQQIAALEEIVGERLIERSRGPRPVALTEAGQMLVRHAEAVVAHLRAAQSDIAAFQAGEAGLLRVGSYQSVSARILPGVLRTFFEAWPKVEARLTEDGRDDVLLASLARGELDLSFTVIPPLDGPFETVELLSDPWVAVIATSSPLANTTDPLPLSALAGQRLIGFRQCRTSALLEAYLRRQGITPNYVFHSDDNGAVRGMAAVGIGIALAPTLAVEPDPRVVVRPLADTPPRVIGLAWQRDRYRSQAMRAFVETARDYCQSLVGEMAYRLPG
ncbi:MAG TPA: LysR family transcriptional regulator [Ktedonobacterales bacterium]|nr:LysR family transcriptional regulator [Ktedonobacterales bacterium]